MNPLSIRAFSGFARNLIVVSFLLFFPGRSWDYPAAWAFLAVYFPPQVLMILWFHKHDPDLLKRRLKMGIKAEGRSVQMVVMLLMRIFFVLKVFVSASDHALHWSNVPIPLMTAADAGILLGFLIQFYVFRENTFASAVIEITEGQKVISTGPYALVRHPMYSGALLVNFLLPVALGSWWGLPFALAMAVIFVVRLLDEEKLLRQSLPGYIEYCQKVPCRLIPHLW